MESRPGEIVRSLAGHDKDMNYIVLKAEGEKLTLVNGRNRKLSKPKIKKQKHVQIIRGVSEEITGKMNSGKLTDADIIHVLRSLKGE